VKGKKKGFHFIKISKDVFFPFVCCFSIGLFIGVTKMGGYRVLFKTQILVIGGGVSTKMGVTQRFRFVFRFLDSCDC